MIPMRVDAERLGKFLEYLEDLKDVSDYKPYFCDRCAAKSYCKEHFELLGSGRYSCADMMSDFLTEGVPQRKIVVQRRTKK